MQLRFTKLSSPALPRANVQTRKKNQLLAGILQYVQDQSANLVKRTVRPHELAVPLLDLLQARQPVAGLASLSPAERTGSRDLHALCCVTSALLGNVGALATSTSCLLAHTGKAGCHAACTGLLGSVLECDQKRLGGLGCEVLEEVVVDLNHGSVDASAEALDLGESEHVVGCGLAGVDANLLLNGLHDAVAASELARCL